MKKVVNTVEDKVDLRALLRSRGIVLGKSGHRKLAGDCPFHAEGEGAFVVNPGRDSFKCSVCGRSGGAAEFLAEFDGISPAHARELVRDEAAAFVRAPRALRTRSTVRRLDCPLDEGASDPELLEQASDYCHERLMGNGAVLERLEELRLGNEEALRKFRIGFADRSLGLRIPERNRRAGGALRKRLQRLGFLRPSGHEHFGGALTLPVPAPDAGVRGIYGHRIGTGLRKEAHRDLWLPPLSPPLWNREAFMGGELVVCLRPLDALTLWMNGVRNCTFLYYGDDGDPAQLADAMRAERVETVRLCFPNTTRGMKAAERCAVDMFGGGFEVFQARFPFGMGAYEYAGDFEDSAAALRDLIAAAEWKGVSAARVAVSRLPEQEGGVCAEQSGDFLFMQMNDREYRATESGLSGETGQMKTTLRLRCGRSFHIDRIDLYSDRDRRRFAARASQETGLDKKLLFNDLGTVLLTLEERRHARSEEDSGAKAAREMPEQTRRTLHAARELVAELKAAGRAASFTRRELRDRIGRGATQTGKHIGLLRDLGLVSLIQCRSGCAFRYEINENGGAE